MDLSQYAIVLILPDSPQQKTHKIFKFSTPFNKWLEDRG